MVGRRPGAGGLKVRVASVGKDRSGLFEPAVQEYARRLGHYSKFELVELRASQREGAEGRDEEAEALLDLRGPRDQLVALDERGQPFSSYELAKFLGSAPGDLLFAIGGDEGLGEAVRKQSRLVLGLSRMTLPHRLARLVLVEQLYRAFTMLKGEPYHK